MKSMSLYSSFIIYFNTAQFILFILCCLRLGSADDCSKAPSFAMRKYCEKVSKVIERERNFDEAKRSFPCAIHALQYSDFSGFILPPGEHFENYGCTGGGSGSNLGAGGDPPVSDCKTLYCLCKRIKNDYDTNDDETGECVLSNGRPLRKAIRKEYRTLTDEERRRFHAALNKIKSNVTITVGIKGERNYKYSYNMKIFDHFSNHHKTVVELAGGAAHGGPGFLPWHREFLKRFENALRYVDPEVALPYWDSVLDDSLPDSQDSILWTGDFLGTTDEYGNITTGPFAGWWTAPEVIYNDPGPNIILDEPLRRNVGVASRQLINETQIWNILSQFDIDRVLGYQNATNDCHIKPNNFQTLEYIHSFVHVYVGGHMAEKLETAANDPAFYLLHSFVDFIWELWRRTKQTRKERENMYATDSIACTTTSHFSKTQMATWEGVTMTNKDAVGNFYTDNLYDYAPRPICHDPSRPICSGSK